MNGDVGSQWFAAGVIAVAGILATAFFVYRAGPGRRLRTADPAKRKETYHALLSESSNLKDFETAEFLLNMAVDLYDRKMKAFDTLDDKAQKLVALVGGGASLYTLLGWFGQANFLHFSPLLLASALFFFLSVLLLLISLYPRERDILAVTEFNSRPILMDPAFRARIAHRLIDAWQELTFELGPVLRKKGRYIYMATAAIVIGAALLLANFLLLLNTRSSTSPTKGTVMKCSGTLSKNTAISLMCRSEQ
jgi:hypothetical protein